MMLTIPFTVLVVFTLNILLIEFGAGDLSGSGAASGAVTQIGPVVTVLVVSTICTFSVTTTLSGAAYRPAA